ncbi:hypothetical protein GALMADRAFT_265099 [Galerina marginata CBS 339.88]|uniref:F-box domain-containing protein n=1 Tax=Galerina marginata (strain CBS 339.88) TaxID=685588 RepID=A0A067TIX1_GALM3|nr:hypothetical protein GALMADRAFT_265099 [Galerina marginata CBS 339.88]
MSRTPSLTTLGLDILINIMAFVKPADIISMRQTCKALYDYSTCRVVWLNAVTEMAKEHCIMKATFPTASMNRQSLEHAALSPAKFSILIGKSAEKEVHPVACRLHIHYLCKKEMSEHGLGTDAYYYSSMLLVPGGRFLITAACPNIGAPSLLQLWDLGIYGLGYKTQALTCQAIPGEHLSLQSLSFAPNGNDVYLVSDYLPHPEASVTARLQVIVHKITGFGESPKFMKINEAVIPTPKSSPVAISGTSLACFYGRAMVLIWDFERNVSATWDCGLIPSRTRIYLNDDMVVFQVSKKLMFCKIPLLLPYNDGMTIHHNQCLSPPMTSLELDSIPDSNFNATAFHGIFLLPHSPWSSNAYSGDYLGFYNASMSNISLFRLEHISSNNSRSVDTTRLPYHLLTTDNIESSDSIKFATALQNCDSNLIFTAVDDSYSDDFGYLDDRLWVYRLTLPTENTRELLMRTAMMYPPEGRKSMCQVELCSATGRLCVRDDHNIFIVDYLNLS